MLALQCRSIVEFGVRCGNSTCTFLAGQERIPAPTCLYSYDIKPCELRGSDQLVPLDHHTIWIFNQVNTTELKEIPHCEMLFIDTLHTYDQVVAEIRHARSVSRWIVLHDTTFYGEKGERGEQGIRPAIAQFLTRNTEWGVLREYKNNYGMMILERHR